jgi:hypothetical protein
VTIGIDQRIEYASNIFFDTVDPVSDGAYKLRPLLRFQQDDAALTYDLRYEPMYTVYFETDGLDGWDQFLDGRGEYQISARDAVEFSGNFSHFRAIRSNSFTDATGAPLTVRNDDGKVTRFLADLAYVRSMSARSQTKVGLDYQQFGYSETGNVPNKAIGGEAQYTYAANARLTVGFNFTGRYRAFEETAALPESTATVLNANLIAEVSITPTLKLSMFGGPSGVLSTQGAGKPVLTNRWEGRLGADGIARGRISPAVPGACSLIDGQPWLRGCAPISASVLNGRLFEQTVVFFDPGERPPSTESEDLTYFITAALVKRFSRGSAELSYVRTEDASAGTASTTILDTVSVRANWSVDEHWLFRLNAGWNRRESISNFTFSLIEAGPSGLASDPDGFGNTFELAEAQGLIPGIQQSNIVRSQGWLDISMVRKLTKRLDVELRFRYVQESDDFGAQNATVEFNNFTGSVGIKYMFDSQKL